MKVSLANLKKAKMKKGTTDKGGAPKPKNVVSKEHLSSSQGSSALARAPATHLSSSPTVKEDDNEVEVILAPTLTIPIFSSVPIPIVIFSRQLSTLVQAEAKRKGKAPMNSMEPEETPQNEEYLEILASVLKTTSTIKSKSLAEKMVKMILLS